MSCHPADIMKVISIHTPRVGSDCDHRLRGEGDLHISIHTPRVGSDSDFDGYTQNYGLFQSTLPVWGVTLHRS